MFPAWSMVLVFARVSHLLHLAEKPDATEAWLLFKKTQNQSLGSLCGLCYLPPLILQSTDVWCKAEKLTSLTLPGVSGSMRSPVSGECRSLVMDLTAWGVVLGTPRVLSLADLWGGLSWSSLVEDSLKTSRLALVSVFSVLLKSQPPWLFFNKKIIFLSLAAPDLSCGTGLDSLPSESTDTFYTSPVYVTYDGIVTCLPKSYSAVQYSEPSTWHHVCT